MTEDQIKQMANRFLAWPLPENFHPDAGIIFKPTFNDHLPEPMKHNPIGTNLFDASQAEAMVRHMVEGIHEWQDIESAPKDGTRVLLWIEPTNIAMPFEWKDGRWMGDDYPLNMATATYWMPSPEAPAITAGARRGET